MKEFTGTVVSGKAEGAYYVDKYNAQFRERLGLSFFPGTLNLRADFSLPSKSISIKPAGKQLKEVKCYKVILNNTIEAFAVVPQMTGRDEDIIEILSERNLREEMKLNDGDSVTLRFVE